MRTPKTESTKELYKKVKEVIEQEKGVEVDFASESGGSISNLPVKSTEYKQWLAERQESNLFIGKDYISRSTDDEIESVKVGEESVSDNVSEMSIDVNIDESTIADGITNDKSDDFINFSIIENNVKLLVGKSDDEIKETLIKQINEHHLGIGKKEYNATLPENINDIITDATMLMIGN